MKKILFLFLLITSVSYGQGLMPTKLKITNNAISTTAPFVNVQETDGFVNKINKSDLIEVIEKDSAINLPVTGLVGKIYVTLDNNRLYRWTGTIYQDLGYVDISNKVDKVNGKSLISDAEIARLSTISNFDNSGNVTALNNKVDKVSGKSLISDAEITRLASVSNVDISGKVDKVAGKSLISDTEITRLSTLSNFDNSGNVTALNNKVDKVTGKSLLSDAEITRLATLANYTHPVNHPASIITQDASNRFVTDAEKSAWNAKQNALGFTAENSTNKNNANGYAGLGSDGKLISSQLPSITISDTFIAASQAAMLAVTAETGDVVVRTDLNKSFILKGATPTILSDWQELLTPTSAVTTVFGRNGAVTAQTGDYTATMVGAPSGSGTSTGTNTGDETVSTIKTKLGITTLTGSNTGDETLATIKTKLGVSVLSGSNTGDQTTITGNAGTATVLQTARTINGVSFNGSANITIADATKEPAFTKNTAFNKNFGTTIGTTAEGNDSRINNGQTAYAWGNHASKYPLFDGTGAYGSWGINISGNAGTATNSSKWNNQNFEYSGIGSISEYIIGKGTDGTWRPASVVETRSWLSLGSNAYSSAAYLPINDGARVNLDYNTKLTSGFYNSDATNVNNPSGQGYSQLIVAKGLDTGLQIAGGHNTDNLHFRGWTNSGANFTPWRKVWHDGNFNPDNYLSVTGGTMSGIIVLGGGVSNAIQFGNAASADLYLGAREGTRIVEIRNGNYLTPNYSACGIKTGSGEFTTNVTATAFFQSSDRRLKTILKRDGDVAYFKWKDNRDNDTHIGYVAQEVKKEFPNQVKADEKGMLSVNYIEVLVAKVQALEKRITELEKQK